MTFTAHYIVFLVTDIINSCKVIIARQSGKETIRKLPCSLNNTFHQPLESQTPSLKYRVHVTSVIMQIIKICISGDINGVITNYNVEEKLLSNTSFIDQRP